MIANIRTRVDFGGITNYANDHKNAKKQGKLLATVACVPSATKPLPTLFLYSRLCGSV